MGPDPSQASSVTKVEFWSPSAWLPSIYQLILITGRTMRGLCMGPLMSHRVHGSLGIADNHEVDMGIRRQRGVSHAMLGGISTGCYNTSAEWLTAVVLGVASLPVTPQWRLTVSTSLIRSRSWVEGSRERDGRHRGKRDRPVYLGAAGQWALQAAAVA